MIIPEDSIRCPVNVIQPLMLSVDISTLVHTEAHIEYYLFEITSRTIAIKEIIYFRTSASLNRKPATFKPPSVYTHRIEKFQIAGNEEALFLYDTIVSASSQGKEAGEIMLQMLSKSIEGDSL